MVRPGQLLAYYVRDGLSTLKLMYLHDTSIFASYNDFKELLIRTSAPLIKVPTNLPTDFTFKYGSVMPLLPNEQDDKTSTEKTRLLELFQKRAAAEPDQDLFIEEVNWSAANISELEYANNNLATIRIRASKNMTSMEISFSSEYAQETLDIGGTKTIFAIGGINGFKRFNAVWYDEAKNTHYEVTASDNKDLTEEQFKLIVESLVKE